MDGPAISPLPETPAKRPPIAGVLLRAGLFLLFVRILGGLFGWALYDLIGYFPAAALSIFAAAALATLIVLRTFERASFLDVGLGWGAASSRHFGSGIAAGMIPVIVAVLGFVLAGYASFERVADAASAFTPGRFAMVFTLLLFGAIGEELMFRGYAFQIILNVARPFTTILPFAVLFAAAHTGNLHASTFPIVNTFLWGVVLGYAYVRSGDLWLPIGLHFGWNMALPLLGAPLSGFDMPLTGFDLKWAVADVISGGQYGLEGGAVTTVMAVGLLLWLWKAKIERQPTALWVSSNQDEE
ncbi:MAG: hypothetical protein C0504_17410 [Candidatus Solibacter sp.]|nr:hypothetical protein [Candidatus Solibacter sp.]